MATDPPSADRRSAPCPDDPTSDLVAQVHNHSRAVIEAELRRLARRAPSLRPHRTAEAPLRHREEGPVTHSDRSATPQERRAPRRSDHDEGWLSDESAGYRRQVCWVVSWCGDWVTGPRFGC